MTRRSCPQQRRRATGWRPAAHEEARPRPSNRRPRPRRTARHRRRALRRAGLECWVGAICRSERSDACTRRRAKPAEQTPYTRPSSSSDATMARRVLPRARRSLASPSRAAARASRRLAAFAQPIRRMQDTPAINNQSGPRMPRTVCSRSDVRVMCHALFELGCSTPSCVPMAVTPPRRDSVGRRPSAWRPHAGSRRSIAEVERCRSSRG